MNFLSRTTEDKFRVGSIKYVMGIDEAGRGPLAGPVVAAACIISAEVAEDIAGIKDSKATTEAQREKTYKVLTNTPGVYWGVSIIPPNKIDEINILQATLLGMRYSAEQIFSKYPYLHTYEVYCLIDGNKLPQEMPVQCEYVIKGDSLMYSIAAASIIAKVTRDRIMLELDKQYPLYQFALHKGYPVPQHRAILHDVGPSEVHRFSYRPVKLAAQRHGYDNGNSNDINNTIDREGVVSMCLPLTPPQSPLPVRILKSLPMTESVTAATLTCTSEQSVHLIPPSTPQKHRVRSAQPIKTSPIRATKKIASKAGATAAAVVAVVKASRRVCTKDQLFVTMITRSRHRNRVEANKALFV